MILLNDLKCLVSESANGVVQTHRLEIPKVPVTFSDTYGMENFSRRLIKFRTNALTVKTKTDLLRHSRANNFFTWPSRFIKQCPWPFEIKNRPVKRASLARLGHSHFAFLIQVKETSVCSFKTRRARLDGQTMFDCRWGCAAYWVDLRVPHPLLLECSIPVANLCLRS